MTTLEQFEDMLRRQRAGGGRAEEQVLRFDPQFRSPFDDLMGTGEDKPAPPVPTIDTSRGQPDGEASFRFMGGGGFGLDGPNGTSYAKVQIAADPDAKPAPFSPDDRTGARAPDPAMYDFRGRHDGGPGGQPLSPEAAALAAQAAQPAAAPEQSWWDKNIGINMGPFGPTAGPNGMLPGLRIPSYTMTPFGPVRSNTLPPTDQPAGWSERNLGVSIAPGGGVAFGNQNRVAPPDPPPAAAPEPAPKPTPVGSIPPPTAATPVPPDGTTAATPPSALAPGFNPVSPPAATLGTPAAANVNPALPINGQAYQNGSFLQVQYDPLTMKRLPDQQLPLDMRASNAGELAYNREVGAASTNDVARSALGLPLIDQPRRQQAALEAQQMARQGVMQAGTLANQKEIATGRNKDAERADFQAKLIADGMSKGLNGPQLEEHVKSGMKVYDKFGGNQTPAPGTPAAGPVAPGKPGQARDPGLELSERARTALARKAVNGQQVPLTYQQVAGFLDTLGPNPQGLDSLVSEIAAGQHGDSQQLMDLIHNYAANNYVRGNPQGIPGMGVNGIWEGGDFVVPGLDGKSPLLSIEANRNAIDRSFNALFGGTAGNTARDPTGRSWTLAEALPGGLSVGLDKKMSTQIAGDRYRSSAALIEAYRRQMAAARGVR